jgi:FkbM family methyltransferase
MTPRLGSYQSSLPFAKDLLDFWFTRFPRWYLFVEERREWQNWDKRVYLSLIERGDVVLDIGANVGAHTVAFSHLVGKRGRVFAFEPVPGNVERLRQTVQRRSRYANISIVPRAVGNPAGVAERVMVKVPGDDLTQASLTPHSAGSWEGNPDLHQYPTLLTSIDAQMAKAHLECVDFVKIDVEGGELDVIQGAKRTLTRSGPLVYCEVYEKWQASFGYTPSDLFEFVQSLGYTEARIIRSGRIHTLRLGEIVPGGLFDTSADVLFATPKYAARLARFDSRYRAQNRPA